MMLLVRKAFDDCSVEDMPYITVPRMFEQTFVRQLMLGVENAQMPEEDVQALFELFPSLNLDLPRHTSTATYIRQVPSCT